MTKGKTAELAELLSGMIRINTVSPPGNERDLAIYIAEILRQHGFSPEIQELGNNRANLICETGRGQDVRLILNGHLDVVPAEGDWKHPPFEGKIDDGYIFGRGACDMKAGLAAMLKAFIDSREEELSGRLCLLFVTDEETSNLGIRSYIAEHSQEDAATCRRNLAIIGEPTDLSVCNAHYGVERYWINVKGESAHSSKPELGINAIRGAAAIVRGLDGYHRELRSRITEWGSPSCAVTMIEGGEKQNSIAARARVFIDRRTVPGEKPEDITAEIKDWIDRNIDLEGCAYDIESYFSFGSGLLDKENPFLREALDAAGGSPEVFPAGCEQGILIGAGYEALVLGPGSIKDAHMPDEKVRIDDLCSAYELYRKLISQVLIKKESDL